MSITSASEKISKIYDICVRKKDRRKVVIVVNESSNLILDRKI